MDCSSPDYYVNLQGLLLINYFFLLNFMYPESFPAGCNSANEITNLISAAFKSLQTLSPQGHWVFVTLNCNKNLVHCQPVHTQTDTEAGTHIEMFSVLSA